MELVTSLSFKNVYKTPIGGSRYHLTHDSAIVVARFPPHYTHTLSLILDICLIFLPGFLFSEIFPRMLATHPKQTTSLHDLKLWSYTMINNLSDVCSETGQTDWLEMGGGGTPW